MSGMTITSAVQQHTGPQQQHQQQREDPNTLHTGTAYTFGKFPRVFKAICFVFLVFIVSHTCVLMLSFCPF